jgi:hypothetical protein
MTTGRRRPRPRRHLPARPVWRCRACAAPWPCQPAKLGLRIAYADDPAALTAHLRGLLAEAVADRRGTHLRPIEPAVLRTRFIDWVRRPETRR